MRKVLLAAVACLLGALAAMAAPPKVVYVRCGKLIFDAEKPAMASAVVVITDGKVVFLIGYSTIYQMVPKR